MVQNKKEGKTGMEKTALLIIMMIIGFFALGCLFLIKGPKFAAKHGKNPKQGAWIMRIYGIGFLAVALWLSKDSLRLIEYIPKQFIKMFLGGFLIVFVLSVVVIVVTKSISWQENRKLFITAPVLIALVFGMLVGFSSLNDREVENTDSYGNTSSDARIAAEDIVRDNLKSPSSADFCGASKYTITRSGNTWTVRGYVDAQNSFGATLRNDFTVVITFTSDTKYTIDSCRITAR